MNVDKFKIRIPFIPFDKYYSLTADEIDDLVSAVESSIQIQLASQDFDAEKYNGPMSIVIEYASQNSAFELQNYTVTGFLVVNTLFPKHRKNVRSDEKLFFGSAPGIYNFSQRISREVTEEETIFIFIHYR